MNDFLKKLKRWSVFCYTDRLLANQIAGKPVRISCPIVASFTSLVKDFLYLVVVLVAVEHVLFPKLSGNTPFDKQLYWFRKGIPIFKVSFKSLCTK